MALPEWTFLFVGDPQAGVAEYGEALSAGFDLAVLPLKGLLDASVRVGPNGRDCYEPNREGPDAFLARAVFDVDPAPAAVVGLAASYQDLERHDLYDLIQARHHIGSFSVVEIVRNPIACYIAAASPPPEYPAWIGTADELVRASQQAEAARRRLARACPDHLAVGHAERWIRLPWVVRFVEAPARPAVRKRTAKQKTLSAQAPLIRDLVRCPPVVRERLPSAYRAEFDAACLERRDGR